MGGQPNVVGISGGIGGGGGGGGDGDGDGGGGGRVTNSARRRFSESDGRKIMGFVKRRISDYAKGYKDNAMWKAASDEVRSARRGKRGGGEWGW